MIPRWETWSSEVIPQQPSSRKCLLPPLTHWTNSKRKRKLNQNSFSQVFGRASNPVNCSLKKITLIRIRTVLAKWLGSVRSNSRCHLWGQLAYRASSLCHLCLAPKVHRLRHHLSTNHVLSFPLINPYS